MNQFTHENENLDSRKTYQKVDLESQKHIKAYTAAFYKQTDQESQKEINKIAEDFKQILLFISDENIFDNLCKKYLTRIQSNKVFEIIYNKINAHFKTRIFINRIITRGHLYFLPQILSDYIDHWNQQFKFTHAILITANPCSKEILDELKENLSKIKQKPVIITNKVKPKHIGGAILNIDGISLKLSYENILQNLTKHLS